MTMESGVASYQGYGSTGEEANFDTVAFRSPTLTTRSRQNMEEPRRRHNEYQALEDVDCEKEEEFSLDCLNKLNQYLITKYPAPKRRAKPYTFATAINRLLGIMFCAICACPCYYVAYKLSKSIHALNGQGDYLSAKARSRMVVCCNITAFICIFVSDALMLTIIVYICKSLKSLFQAIDE